LLSGVTLITHGFNGSVDDWVTAMADAIAGRPDLSIDQPRYRVEVTDPGHDGGPLAVVNTSRSGPAIGSAANPEIVILLNWADVAGTLTLGGGYHRSTVDVAAAVAEKLVSANFLSDFAAPLAELPFHLISHSRGASLVGELAKELGEHGVWVDQVTTLDPHPVDGEREPIFANYDFDDAPMTAWENVTYWDNYWRTDGERSFDFTGEPVANVYDLQLTESVLASGGSSFEHSDVHTWYHGTIDTSNAAHDGDQAVPLGWYGGPHPARTATGFFYSRMVDGNRADAGMAASLGGSATRSAISTAAADWPSVLELNLGGGLGTFAVGATIPVSFYYQSIDSAATISLQLDADRNPYNATSLPASQLNAGQTTATPVLTNFDLPTSEIGAGVYYVSAQITNDGGQTRYAYAHQPILLTSSASVAGRHVFYNRSFFDGNDPAANAGDDAAIDTTKTALLPGQTASFANYTGYSRGLNGLMIDVANLAAAVSPSDFVFKTGNNNNPASWPTLATAPSVSIRPGEGTGGSDRVTLIWPDGAIAKTWLQVTLLANANTGLASPDVFYFGNAVGEVGNTTANAIVTSADESLIRINFTTGFGTVPVTSPFDIDKNRFVQASDAALSRANQTTAFTALRLITVPAASSPLAPREDSNGSGAGATAGLSSAASSAVFDAPVASFAANSPAETPLASRRRRR
jgi:hypothetical protein